LPVVYSWKTVGAVGDREFMAAHYDDQGLSEGWLVGRGKNIYNHMVYIIKGYAKSNEDGTKTFINGLVYPYVNPKVPFSYKALSPVFKAGWNRTPVWTLPGGVDDWLQFLLANQPDALDKFWASPGRVTRLGPKMDDWLKAMIWEMEEAWDKAMWAQGLGDPGLTTLFPIWNQSCFRYRRPCEMLPICHDGVQPLSSGMYELRKPHHVVVEEEV
jgi:hypothetical protein